MKSIFILAHLFFVTLGLSAQTGAALSFDGIDDFIIIPHNSLLKPKTGITIEAWINPADVHTKTYYEIYRKEDGNARHLFSFQEHGTVLSFGLGIAGAYSELDVPINVADYENQWVHVAATYDGVAKRIYRNGILIGAQNISGLIDTTGTAQARIGSSFNGQNEFFNGTMDEVRLWSRGLPAEEILSGMNCEINAIAQNGLIALYHFNQGIAGQNNGDINWSLLDAGSYGLNGSLVNFTLTGTSSNWVANGAIQTGLSCILPDSQFNPFVTTKKAGYWKDRNVWSNNKIPVDSSIVFLSNDVIIDSNANCRFLNTNGFNVNVSSGVNLSVLGKDRITRDSLISYNIPTLAGNDTLLAHYFVNSLEEYIYGIRGTDGNIIKITSGKFNDVNSPGTVFCVKYDDNIRVTLMYTVTNGIKDTSLVKFSYTDTSVFISRFNVNWADYTLTLRRINVLKAKGDMFAPVTNFAHRRQSGTALSDFDMNKYITAHGSQVVVNIVLCVVAGVLAVEILGPEGLALVKSTGGAFWVGFGGTALSNLFTIAHADELPAYDIVPPSRDSADMNNLADNNPQLNDNDWLGSPLPFVFTNEPLSVTGTIAVTSGSVLDEGGATVTERGICWDITPNPNIVGSRTINGAGIGLYTSTITSLNNNTHYYAKAYATNIYGTAYGDAVEFTTNTANDIDSTFIDPRDGQVYTFKHIGTQVWMTQNLNYVTDSSWCYDNNSANCAVYGRLYTWYDAISVAPPGWHLPSKDEWTTFLRFTNAYYGNNGDLLDSLYWNLDGSGYPPGFTFNQTGFSARPGGEKHHIFDINTNHFYQPEYYNIYNKCSFWTSTMSNTYSAWIVELRPNNIPNLVYYGLIFTPPTVEFPILKDNRDYFSIRCVRNY